MALQPLLLQRRDLDVLSLLALGSPENDRHLQRRFHHLLIKLIIMRDSPGLDIAVANVHGFGGYCEPFLILWRCRR